ncbi:MAG: class F sortase [Chloroflexi bacterium]|nr:class F sortase [Chloroflexota bacterium]
MGDRLRQLFGRPAALTGTLFVVAGVLFIGYAVGFYFELVPGSKVTVPRPPALDRPRPTLIAELAPTPVPTMPPTAVPTRTPIPRGVVVPQTKPRLVTGAMLAPPDPSVFDTPMPVPDADDRLYCCGRPHPGMAVHLQIDSIDVDTDVVEGGIIENDKGEAEWETVPFVAVHYRETARVGARGNAVISGHVVTISMGNVFRDLYKLDYNDVVKVRTEEGLFTYLVDELKLVRPDQIEVMQPTKDAVLTLITCGGEFDTRTRTFSHRLIVTAKLADWEKLPAR